MKFAIDIGSSTLKIVARGKNGLICKDFPTALGLHLKGDFIDAAGICELKAAVKNALIWAQEISTPPGGQMAVTGKKSSTPPGGEAAVTGKKTSVAATAVFRKAKNAAQIAEQLRREFGINLRVLSQSEEAEFCLQAVCANCDGVEVFADIGGGSTEISFINFLAENEISAAKISAANLQNSKFATYLTACARANIQPKLTKINSHEFSTGREFFANCLLFERGLLNIAPPTSQFDALQTAVAQHFAAINASEIHSCSKAIIYALSVPQKLANYELNDYDFHNHAATYEQIAALAAQITAMSDAQKHYFFDSTAEPTNTPQTPVMSTSAPSRAFGVMCACAILLRLRARRYIYCAHALKEALLDCDFKENK